MRSWMLQKVSAPKSIWYHGTDIKNLRRIMAEGLLPEGPKKVWDTEGNDTKNEFSPSKATYGGVYVSNNLMTSVSAVKDYNNHRKLVVICELQPNTFYMDEDDIVHALTHPLQRASEFDNFVFREYIAIVKGLNGYNQTPEYYKQKYFNDFIERNENVFHTSLHPELVERLVRLVGDTWFPSLQRLAAYFAQGRDQEYRYKVAYSAVFRDKIDWDTIPPMSEVVPSRPVAEAEFRKHVEQITRTMKMYARPGYSGYRETARIPTIVGYSGSNKIIGLVEIAEPPQGDRSPVRLIVHYGIIPPDFLKQYNERMGGKYEIIYYEK